MGWVVALREDVMTVGTTGAQVATHPADLTGRRILGTVACAQAPPTTSHNPRQKISASAVFLAQNTPGMFIVRSRRNRLGCHDFR
jgi:hypothetical protein